MARSFRAMIASLALVVCMAAGAQAIAVACVGNIAPNVGDFKSSTTYKGLVDGNPSSNITINWGTPNGACVSEWTVETYRKTDNKRIGSAGVKTSQPYYNYGTYTLATASAGAQYYFKITPKGNNKVGGTFVSSPVTAATQPTCDSSKAPGLAKNIVMPSTTNQGSYSSITVRWSHPDGKTCVTKYTVQVYKKGGSNAFIQADVVPVTPLAATTDYTAKGLSPYAEYVFKITSYNSKGSVGSINSPAFRAAPQQQKPTPL